MVTAVQDIHTAVQKNLIRLKGSVQNYDWGKRGSDSLVARLGSNGLGPDFKVNENDYYAEVSNVHLFRTH